MKITDCKSDWTPTNYNVTGRERKQIHALVNQGLAGHFKIGRTKIEVVSIVPFRCILRKMENPGCGFPMRESVGFFAVQN